MTPEERAEEINSTEGPRLKALILEAVALAESRKVPFQAKAERIIDIADALSRAITPHTPCASGTCSHCCHMATAISGFEARMIGRYTGRNPRHLGREKVASFELERELQARFTGVVCPFLVGGRCSVYPVRPAACRLHHNLMDTPDNCRIQSGDELSTGEARERMSTPHMNLTLVTAAVAVIYVADDFGDIREFFP